MTEAGKRLIDLVEEFAARLKDEYLPIVSSYFSEEDANQFELEDELCNITDEIAEEFTVGEKIKKK